jgi:hypothetical protein
MSKSNGGTSESAQLETKHKKFLEELHTKLESGSFTDSQSDEIKTLADSITPGDREGVAKVLALYKKFQKENESSNEINHDDWNEFVVFAKATQMIPSDADTESFSESEQSDLVARFKQWIQKGKPAAINPLADEEPEKILRVTRLRIFGRQKLTAIVKGKDLPMGIELVPQYRKYTDNGKENTDTTKVIANTRKYNIDYTEKFARELVTRCEKEAEHLQLTFKDGGRTIYIRNKENFFKDFDQVLNDVKHNIPV